MSSSKGTSQQGSDRASLVLLVGFREGGSSVSLVHLLRDHTGLGLAELAMFTALGASVCVQGPFSALTALLGGAGA